MKKKGWIFTNPKPGWVITTGDECLESVKIVQEDCTWPSWHPKTAGVVRPGEEELVLEVVATSSVQEKSKPNMAWNAVMEACIPVMEEVDWQRSMPYSIQEMKHALGIEVAYQMVVQVKITKRSFCDYAVGFTSF